MMELQAKKQTDWFHRPRHSVSASDTAWSRGSNDVIGLLFAAASEFSWQDGKIMVGSQCLYSYRLSIIPSIFQKELWKGAASILSMPSGLHSDTYSTLMVPCLLWVAVEVTLPGLEPSLLCADPWQEDKWLPRVYVKESLSRRKKEKIENFMGTEVLEDGREGHGWAENACEEEEWGLHRGGRATRAACSRQYRNSWVLSRRRNTHLCWMTTRAVQSMGS